MSKTVFKRPLQYIYAWTHTIPGRIVHIQQIQIPQVPIFRVEQTTVT